MRIGEEDLQVASAQSYNRIRDIIVGPFPVEQFLHFAGPFTRLFEHGAPAY